MAEEPAEAGDHSPKRRLQQTRSPRGPGIDVDAQRVQHVGRAQDVDDPLLREADPPEQSLERGGIPHAERLGGAAVQGLGRNEPHVEGIRVLPPDDEVSFDPHAVSIAPTVSSPTGTREGGAATQVGFPDGRGPSRAWGLSAALGATS